MGEVSLGGVYAPSADVVAREIEGEIIIVPLTAGVGDMEGELFTLNEVGRDIWHRFDGQRPMKQIIEDLCEDYDASYAEIETDVMGLTRELLKRRILCVKSTAS